MSGIFHGASFQPEVVDRKQFVSNLDGTGAVGNRSGFDVRNDECVIDFTVGWSCDGDPDSCSVLRYFHVEDSTAVTHRLYKNINQSDARSEVCVVTSHATKCTCNIELDE